MSILLADIVGFGAIAAIWDVVTGEARDIARVILAIHLLFTSAFVGGSRSRRQL
ncbi:hypothetical protein MAXJ12_30422 [Mesorhizobium alhagi CCNWXJ12-2]|uniref:Uncharacterized protein n=1 Tax=Mesorhizobium alhagi CCNWXJ12-2 TaxID=1107882 RepID=H0I0U7_9HYPH|nr:hypothetical protein MAXJ12_30422 [Mesorhizobium alhagi CCNWXJ12-2]